MYRYYSKQRPIGPGTYPNKSGCEVCNYPYKMQVIGHGEAWGYINYVDPLSDEECSKYELTPEKKKISVEYELSNSQIVSLNRILAVIKKAAVDQHDENICRDMTVDDLFRIMMTGGCNCDIDSRIDFWRKAAKLESMKGEEYVRNQSV